VRGENVLYFNVQDKGVVTVTGCCHPGLLSLFSSPGNPRRVPGLRAYAGLHLSLFETWDRSTTSAGVKAFKPRRSRRTTAPAGSAEKAVTAGVPIVKGRTRTRPTSASRCGAASNAYLTNDDSVVF
jgi:7,8-dihydropterin-6-yl-methyl-4-(beta-D-ribofuranosyl)aminobenzene 5'-phosphate synthase